MSIIESSERCVWVEAVWAEAATCTVLHHSRPAGYFPYVLKGQFPDGVPIKLVDLSKQAYAFNSSAASTGAAPRPAAHSNVHGYDELEGLEAAPLSRDALLAKLPQTVIRGGKVIEVRARLLTAPSFV